MNFSGLTAGEILVSLKRLGVDIRLNGENLRLKAPTDVLTPALQAELKARKPEIIRFLRDRPPMSDTERQAVDGWLESIHELEPEWNEAQAWAKAIELLETSRRGREKRLQEATALYRKQGWVRIFSSYLGRSIYLVRDSRVEVPDSSLPVYTESEIQAIKGFSREELLTLYEAKSIFGEEFLEARSTDEKN